jgi:hypothetical protein
MIGALLLAAAAPLALIGAADAAEVPKQFVGNWCMVKSNADLLFKRGGKCRNPLREQLVVGPHGFINHDGTCRLISREADRMKFDCTNGDDKWSMTHRFAMVGGNLRLSPEQMPKWAIGTWCHADQHKESGGTSWRKGTCDKPLVIKPDNIENVSYRRCDLISVEGPTNKHGDYFVEVSCGAKGKANYFLSPPVRGEMVIGGDDIF